MLAKRVYQFYTPPSVSSNLDPLHPGSEKQTDMGEGHLSIEEHDEDTSLQVEVKTPEMVHRKDDGRCHDRQCDFCLDVVKAYKRLNLDSSNFQDCGLHDIGSMEFNLWLQMERRRMMHTKLL